LREACLYISEHSKAEVIIVEDNKQLSKYIETGHRLSNLKAFVVWAEPIDPIVAQKCTADVFSWQDFLNLGAAVPQAALDERAAVTRCVLKLLH
jgi:long-chain-fatty-acid--CoA ligase ACSBG